MTTRGRTHLRLVHFGDEMAQHRLGHFEVGDHAVFQRPNRDDITRRATEHALGFVADRENLARPARTATTDGSRRTMPWSLTYTSVFAVPRSIPISLENKPKKPLNIQSLPDLFCCRFNPSL